MRYDCVTLGNHEFDYTPKGLAQILGAAQINLEDFELRHVSPEYGGVLVILVAGADNAERARELLRREGYSAA